MATSEVGLCNISLSLLGDVRITSLNDEARQARQCKALYADARDFVLADFPWNFALRYQQLAQEINDAFDWDYKYALPELPYCIRALMTDHDADGVEWVIQGRHLYINESAVNLKYIARIESVTEFSPQAVQAIAVFLSAQLAQGVTGSKSKATEQLELYKLMRSLSFEIDSQEGTGYISEIDQGDDDLIQVR